MAFDTLGKVINLKSGLSSSDKMVLIVLAHVQNHETRKCYPSQEYIAEHACLTERGVRKVLARLEDNGLIKRIKRVGYSDHYLFTLPEQRSNATSSTPERDTGDPGTRVTSTPAPSSAKQGIEHRKEQGRDNGSRSVNGYAPSPSVIEWASAKGVLKSDVDRACERMVNWAEGKDVRRKSWDATLRNWILSDIDDGKIKQQSSIRDDLKGGWIDA